MGKRKSAKAGGSGAGLLRKEKASVAAASKQQQDRDAMEQDSSDSEESGFVAFQSRDKHGSDDEDNEQEVFNLAVGDEEESDDSGSEESGDSDDEDEDDDYYDDDGEVDLKHLAEQLPDDIKRKVLGRKKLKSGNGISDDEEEEDDDEDDEDAAAASWGRKKQTYWSGDTADLEIGQEMEDAEEEEAAAQELHQAKVKRMRASDFFDDVGGAPTVQDQGSSDSDSSDTDSDSDSDSDSVADEDEEENMAQLLSKGQKGSFSNDKQQSKSSSLNAAKKVTKSLLASTNGATSKKVGGGDGSGLDALIAMGDLEQAALQNGNNTKKHPNQAQVEVEKLSKDVSRLSKQERLDLLAQHSPELLGIVAELKDLVLDLNKRVMPLREFLAKMCAEGLCNEEDEVVQYLETRQQLLLSYCVDVLFYLLLKARGRSVQNHPVMKQMLKLRFVMEKMRPLDAKLKHQIDRLLQLARMEPEELEQQKQKHGSAMLRPNPAALLANANSNSKTGSKSSVGKKKSGHKGKGAESDSDDSGEHASENDDDEEEEDDEDDHKASAEVYKAPKRTAVPYKENETEMERREQRLERQRSKLRRSELMETLREEFSTAPEEGASSGLGRKSGDLLKLQEEAEERARYEEDRFVRTTMSRKDKKSIKRRSAEASRLDNFDDIGDVGDFEEIARLAGGGAGAGVGSGMDMNAADEYDNDNDGDDDGMGDSGGGGGKAASAALQKAVQALMQQQGGGGKRGQNDPDMSGMDKGRKRRRAPMGGGRDDDDDEDGLGGGFVGGSGGDDDDNNNDDDDDDGDNPYDGLLDDFAGKKKQYLAQKKQHYTAEPRYGGVEQAVGEGDKRAATYEIMRNRGLTPHRKKANRNPRVKKREMYNKALVRRKGQVREVVSGAAGSYAGELTGIKANVARSRKIGV